MRDPHFSASRPIYAIPAYKSVARRTGITMLLISLLSACASLPSSGPTSAKILAGDKTLSGDVKYRIVNILASADLPKPVTATESWAVPPLVEQRIAVGPGDVLSVRLFEVGTRLFSGISNSNITDTAAVAAVGEALPPVQVDELGDITLPYAGTLHVAGQSTGEIEQQINRQYAAYSQALRAMVSVSRNETNKVVVAGAVAKAGRFSLSPAHERVLDIISEAGGVSARTEDVLVRLTRSGTTSSARLRQIMDNPRLNEVLTGGDMLELDLQPQSYLVFGAAGKVAQVSFNADRVSLAEAIARAGGPLDSQADPTGVFLFRYDAADASGLRTIYRLNLMQPGSYFLAQNFYLQDKDVLYFANARSNQPSKFVQILNQLFSPFLTVRAIAN